MGSPGPTGLSFLYHSFLCVQLRLQIHGQPPRDESLMPHAPRPADADMVHRGQTGVPPVPVIAGSQVGDVLSPKAVVQ